MSVAPALTACCVKATEIKWGRGQVFAPTITFTAIVRQFIARVGNSQITAFYSCHLLLNLSS